MLTWGSVLDRLRRQINDAVLNDDGTPITDEDGNNTVPEFSDQCIADFWEDAQNDLVLYVARTKTFVVPSTAQSASLPDELYRIEWVRYDRGTDPYFIKQLDPEISVRDVDEQQWEGLYWYKTDDQIVFTDTLSYSVTVCFGAFYPVPTPSDRDQPIYVPRWAVQALVYYVTAEALERKVVEDPDLRRWANRNTDAGKPTDNPFLQVARYFLGRYHDVINKHLAKIQERPTWPSSFH